MAPSFSKTPVALIADIPVISGLMCTHPNCGALFSNLEDSEAHAIKVHAWKVAAATCGIYEALSKKGKIRLHRVVEESGERVKNS